MNMKKINKNRYLIILSLLLFCHEVAMFGMLQRGVSAIGKTAIRAGGTVPGRIRIPSEKPKETGSATPIIPSTAQVIPKKPTGGEPYSPEYPLSEEEYIAPEITPWGRPKDGKYTMQWFYNLPSDTVRMAFLESGRQLEPTDISTDTYFELLLTPEVRKKYNEKLEEWVGPRQQVGTPIFRQPGQSYSDYLRSLTGQEPTVVLHPPRSMTEEQRMATEKMHEYLEQKPSEQKPSGVQAIDWAQVEANLQLKQKKEQQEKEEREAKRAESERQAQEQAEEQVRLLREAKEEARREAEEEKRKAAEIVAAQASARAEAERQAKEAAVQLTTQEREKGTEIPRKEATPTVQAEIQKPETTILAEQTEKEQAQRVKLAAERARIEAEEIQAKQEQKKRDLEQEIAKQLKIRVTIIEQKQSQQKTKEEQEKNRRELRKITALVTVISLGLLTLQELERMQQDLQQDVVPVEHLEKVQAEIERLKAEERAQQEQEEKRIQIQLEKEEAEQRRKGAGEKQQKKSQKEQLEDDLQTARQRVADLMAQLSASRLTLEDENRLQDSINIESDIIRLLEKEQIKLEEREKRVREQAPKQLKLKPSKRQESLTTAPILPPPARRPTVSKRQGETVRLPTLQEEAEESEETPRKGVAPTVQEEIPRPEATLAEQAEKEQETKEKSEAEIKRLTEERTAQRQAEELAVQQERLAQERQIQEQVQRLQLERAAAERARIEAEEIQQREIQEREIQEKQEQTRQLESARSAAEQLAREQEAQEKIAAEIRRTQAERIEAEKVSLQTKSKAEQEKRELEKKMEEQKKNRVTEIMHIIRSNYRNALQVAQGLSKQFHYIELPQFDTGSVSSDFTTQFEILRGQYNALAQLGSVSTRLNSMKTIGTKIQMLLTNL